MVETLGCPICMELAKAFTIKNYAEVYYLYCHCQFLPLDHPYRRNKKAFKKRVVDTSPAPPYLSSLEIWNRVAHFILCHELPQEEEEKQQQQQQQEKDLPSYSHTYNWTKQSIFWRFPYWKTQVLHHNNDAMHMLRKFFLWTCWHCDWQWKDKRIHIMLDWI